MPPPLTVERTAPTSLALVGEFDTTSADVVRALVSSLIDEGAASLELDLSRLSFIDSRAIGVLIGAARQLRELGGMLVLRAPTRPIQRVLEITGLEHLDGVEVVGGLDETT